MAHKIIKPETYECSLCALTYGAFSEKKAWRKFKENTDIEMTFLHKDEFEKAYGVTYKYPVILKETDPFETLLDANEIGKLKSVEELTKQIKKLTTQPTP